MDSQKPPYRNPPPTTEWPGRPAGYEPPLKPPAMRGGSMPHADGSAVMLVAAVFLVGFALGAKMVGGW